MPKNYSSWSKTALKSCLSIFTLMFFCSSAFALSKKRPQSNPIPSPGPTVPHGEQLLRVLSYNVHGLPLQSTDETLLRDIGRALKSRRLAGTAPQLVAIQEGFHAGVDLLISESGYPYFKSGPPSNWPRTNSGLLILSEYPILEYARHAFKLENSAGFDWNAEKGVLLTKIRLPQTDQPLYFLDTHLQADYDDLTATLEESIGARQRQYVEIGDFMRKNLTPDATVLFAGDFNTMGSMSDYYDLVAQIFLTNSAERCAFTLLCNGNVDPMSDLYTSLDHQFLRLGKSGLSLEPVHFEKNFRSPYNGRILSDHDGLEVHYKVRW